MITHTSDHEEIFKTFLNRYPDWASNVDYYKPRHLNAIRVYFKDGRKFDYNGSTDTIRYVNTEYVENVDDMTDEYFRNVFANNLIEQMHMKGFNQKELAARTKLSTAMISKYIKKQSTPTIANFERIAKVLNCSREDLLD